MKIPLLVYFLWNGLTSIIIAFNSNIQSIHPNSFPVPRDGLINPTTPPIHSKIKTSNLSNPPKSITPKSGSSKSFTSETYIPTPLSSEKKTKVFTEEDYQFQLQWYVISETKGIRPNTPYEAKIWGKTYVYWKDSKGTYYAIQNTCNHRAASLSKGVIIPEKNCIQCPYHGLEFDGNGLLKLIPGQNQPSTTNLKSESPKSKMSSTANPRPEFKTSNFTTIATETSTKPCSKPSQKFISAWNQPKFPILEKEGWLYLNIIPEHLYSTTEIDTKDIQNTLFIEPEASIKPSARVFCTIPSIKTYARIVSENLLDILHITYVHSFGNKESPTPLNEPIPYTMRTYRPNDGYHTHEYTSSANFTTPYSQSVKETPRSQETKETQENSDVLLQNESIPFFPKTPSKMQKSQTKKSKRRMNIRTRFFLLRNKVYLLLNPIHSLIKMVTHRFMANSLPSSPSPSSSPSLPLSKLENTPRTPIHSNTDARPGNENIPSKNQQYGIRYMFETNPNSVIRKLFQYHHIIIETEFLLPHLTVSRVRFGPFFKTVVAFTLPVTDKETKLFIKLYRNYWLKESVPSFVFPFSAVSYLAGTLLESMADSLMIWMLKETFKEDASILENLTNEEEQQGKYHLKYDKFPYLYRNLYKKYIHSKESSLLLAAMVPLQNTSNLPMFFPYYNTLFPTTSTSTLETNEKTAEESSLKL